MEIRPYVVEQHFGSELVDIEVEIGFMETRLKTNKMKEKRSQTEHLLLVLHFFVRLVAKQTKGKMIVNVIKKSQHSFYELFRSPFTFGIYPQRCYKTADNSIFSTFKSFMGVSNPYDPPRRRPYDPEIRQSFK